MRSPRPRRRSSTYWTKSSWRPGAGSRRLRVSGSHHGGIPEAPLGAAHGGHPVAPQLDQLVVAIPGSHCRSSRASGHHPHGLGRDTIPCRQLALKAHHFAPSDARRPSERACGPGARSGSMAPACAVSHPALLRAPSMPGPFATGGRTARCRGSTFDANGPGHPTLRAGGSPGTLHRTGPRACPPHPPPVPRTAHRRAEHRSRLHRRHQWATTATAEPRPGIVVRDHDQPQPGRSTPAHGTTIGARSRQAEIPWSPPAWRGMLFDDC